MSQAENNNKKKFAFLSSETIPDYRPRDTLPQIDKSQKTSTNQSTKFHQLQQMFGNTITSEPNNEELPLYKQIAVANENLHNENEVSIYLHQI